MTNWPFLLVISSSSSLRSSGIVTVVGNWWLGVTNRHLHRLTAREKHQPPAVDGKPPDIDPLDLRHVDHIPDSRDPPRRGSRAAASSSRTAM